MMLILQALLQYVHRRNVIESVKKNLKLFLRRKDFWFYSMTWLCGVSTFCKIREIKRH